MPPPTPSGFADLPNDIKYGAGKTLILFAACTKAVLYMHTVRRMCQPRGADSNSASWPLPTAEQWKFARMQSLKKKPKLNKRFLNSMRTAKPLLFFFYFLEYFLPIPIRTPSAE